jgi:YD repeat-containing protein
MAEKDVLLTASPVKWAITAYTYDGRHQKIGEVGPYSALSDPLPHTQWKYDGAGNVVSVQDARGKTTDIVYDGFSRARLATAPEVFTADGNLVRPKTQKSYDSGWRNE